MNKGYCIETRDGGPPEIVRQSNGALTFHEARRMVVDYWVEEERKAHAKMVDAVMMRESDFGNRVETLLATDLPRGASGMRGERLESRVKIWVCMACKCSIDVPGAQKTPEKCPRCGEWPLRAVADRAEAKYLLQGKPAERYYVCLHCTLGITEVVGMRKTVTCGNCNSSMLERMKDVDEMYSFIAKLAERGIKTAWQE